MTRARALKHAIRARVARTGERYTTARRHVLNALQPKTARTVAAPVPPKPRETPARSRTISDAKFVERTGHGLPYWFEVLDRFKAVEKGHTAAARHLAEVHDVDGWYAQGITVAYERARGVRVANQRCDGVFEVSVSKVIPVNARDIVSALNDARTRRTLAAADAELVAALAAALDNPTSKGFVIRPDGLARFRYKWNDSTVQLYVVPKDPAKVSFVATNSKLASAGMVDERRGRWKSVINALTASLSS